MEKEVTYRMRATDNSDKGRGFSSDCLADGTGAVNDLWGIDAVDGGMGRSNKAGGERFSSMMVFVPETIPVPRNSVITSAELRCSSAELTTEPFSYDMAILTPDNRWTETGTMSGQTQNLARGTFNLHAHAENGVTTLAQNTNFGVTDDGFIIIGRDTGNSRAPQNIGQTVIITQSGTWDNTQMMCSVNVTGGWGPGPWMRPVIYRCFADDGSDDRPNIAAGSLGSGNIRLMATFTTTPTILDFTGLGGSGSTFSVTAGQRYCVYVERNWTRVGGGSNYLQVHFTFDAYGGLPTMKGRPDAFANANYGIQRELPSIFDVDGTTPFVDPWGSRLRTPAPDFPAIGDPAVLDGWGPILNEWFSHPDYDPDHPLGIVVGPGDADFADNRIWRSKDFSPAQAADEEPRLVIKYRRRKAKVW